MLEVIGGILLGLLGVFVLLIIIYLASGIQARAWLDVFDKYFENKFTNKFNKN
jgi:hypothetical protein